MPYFIYYGFNLVYLKHNLRILPGFIFHLSIDRQNLKDFVHLILLELSRLYCNMNFKVIYFEALW